MFGQCVVAVVPGSQITEQLPEPHMHLWRQWLVAKEEHLVIDQGVVDRLDGGRGQLLITAKLQPQIEVTHFGAQRWRPTFHAQFPHLLTVPLALTRG